MKLLDFIVELKKQNIHLKLENDIDLKILAPQSVLKPDIVDKLKDNKTEIINILKKSRKSDFFDKIPKIQVQESYSTISSQKRMYVLQKFDENSVAYNLPDYYIISGKLDIELLNKSLKKNFIRHESLRTRFNFSNDELIQIVEDDIEFELVLDKIDALEVENVKREFVKPFDLSKAPLVRVKLLEIENEKYLLLLDMHHIIADGMSLGVFMKDLKEFYEGNEKEGLPIQYKDYAFWERNRVSNKNLLNQESYWKEKFKGNIPKLSIPLDYSRPAIRDYSGAHYFFEIDSDTTFLIRQFCKKEGITLYVFLLSCYKILLSKYSGQDDIVVGSINAGREHPDLKNIIGIFLKTIALRSFPSRDKIFKAYVKEVQNTCLEAFENMDYPFERLVNEVDVTRDLGRSPIFDVMFILQNFEVGLLELGNLKITRDNIRTNTSKYDLTLSAIEGGDKIFLDLEYSTCLFKRSTIAAFTEHLKELVINALKNTETTIGNISLINSIEKKKLLYQFNNTALDIDKNSSICQLFENQVTINGDKSAVVFEGMSMTYSELNEKSNQLARRLLQKGINENSIIGIMINRSFELIICIMSVLKIRCGYMPIDPTYPVERINYMLKKSDASLLLVNTDKALDSIQINMPCVNLFENEVFEGESSNIGINYSSRDIAYLIFTSGSTGTPKGVLVNNFNVISFIEGISSRISITKESNMLCIATVSFDAFVLETIFSLVKGLTIILTNEKEQLDPDSLLSLMKENNVDILLFTPSRLEMLLEDDDGELLNSVSTLLTGGEELTSGLVDKIKKNYEGYIYNLYGPTEITVCSNIKQIIKSDDINIGRPIANTYIRILDYEKKLSPIGLPGELYIGGYGVTNGYWGNKKLTEKCFIDDPLSPGQKVYKTGDFGRWNSKGEIEFLGRVDSQVKIRGRRIELREIENCLRQYKDVERVIVSVVEDNQSNSKSLCAYIIKKNKLNIRLIKEFLFTKLPSFMIPVYYVEVNDFLYTPNGKIDKKRLPKPNMNNMEVSDFEAPVTDQERKLVLLYENFFNRKKISRNDNFFDLGGDSLKAIRLVQKIENTFDITLDVQKFLENQSPKQLASIVNQARVIKASLVCKEYYFFGNRNKKLFGICDYPKKNEGDKIGVLICLPIGQEYIQSNLSLINLANSLAKADFFTFRFHYYGCGESDGEFSDIDISGLNESVDVAYKELNTKYALNKIYVIGIRLGALLIQNMFSNYENVKGLILWNPIVSGAKYISELKSTHRKWERGSFAKNKLMANKNEFHGFSYSSKFIKQISKLKFNVDGNLDILILKKELEELTNYNSKLGKLPLIELHPSRSHNFWIKQDSEENKKSIPLEDIETIVNWLKSKKNE